MVQHNRYVLFVLVLWGLHLLSCGKKQGDDNTLAAPNYPSNRANEKANYTRWGEVISNPYRWLENIENPNVLNWAQRQNKTTFDFVSQLPQRVALLEELEQLVVDKEYKKAKREGNFYFYTMAIDRPGQEIVYYTPVGEEKEKLFVNPQRFSGNENARFASLGVSPDNKYAAFSLQDPLSKKEKIFIKNLEQNLFLRDIITASYNTTIAWDNQGGFFYNKGFAPEFGLDTVSHAVFYHIPGQNPSSDIPVFFHAAHRKAMNNVFVSSNQRFILIRSVIDKNHAEIRYTDLNAPPPNTFKLLSDEVGADAFIVDSWNEKFIVQTRTQAPKGRVVVIDSKKPSMDNWETLISESEDLIQRVYSMGGAFYVRSASHMSGKITAYDSSGYRLNTVELPGTGIIEGFAGKPSYNEVLYTYQSFNQPLRIFTYDLKMKRSSLFRQTENKIKADDYVVKKEFCLTPEGIGIPLLIFHKKDLAPDGGHPLVLSFSGGLREPYLPQYSMGNIPFVKHGGVIVIAAVRGGNEMGEEWHAKGAKQNKMRMSKDVKASIDYLIQEKYTSAGNIAILTKHTGTWAATETILGNPGLIKLLGVFQGVFDYTRYDEYNGCISCLENELESPEESKDAFMDLKNHSPLLKNASNYSWPAVYLEHKIIDPVVSPVHSFKFIASLQDASTGGPPKLIRIDNECCIQNRRQELFILSERWAFAMYTLGMKLK